MQGDFVPSIYVWRCSHGGFVGWCAFDLGYVNRRAVAKMYACDTMTGISLEDRSDDGAYDIPIVNR